MTLNEVSAGFMFPRSQQGVATWNYVIPSKYMFQARSLSVLALVSALILRFTKPMSVYPKE